MRSISDNELDKLFQDAAQRVEPEFDPEDWEKLAKRIDRSDRINLFRRIAIYLSVALLIIFSTWTGINYYKGRPDGKKNSVSNSTVPEVSESTDSIKKEINSEASSSAQNASIDRDADNDTSTRSLSREATSSSSIQSDVNSSAAEASANQNNTINTRESKDIAGINKTAASIKKSDDQQKIQKPKRTVAGAKESRDEESLSASQSSGGDRINQDSPTSSTNQQHASTLDREGKSSLSNATVQDESSATQSRTKSVSNHAVNSEAKNSSTKRDAGIASGKQLSSTTSTIDVNTSAKKQNAIANDTSAIENADVKNRDVTLYTNTIDGNNEKTSGTDHQATAGTTLSRSSDQKLKPSVSSADTSTMAGKRAKGNEVQADIEANQSGKTDQTIAGDSLSTNPSSRKLADNILLTGDVKDIPEKSTGAEETKGNRSSAKSILKANSLSGGEPNVSNTDEKNSISSKDTIAASNNGRPHTKVNTFEKNENAGSVNDNNVQLDQSGKVLRSNENDYAIDKASEKQNDSIANQNASLTSGSSADSLNIQKELTAAEKKRQELNGVAVNDSVESKPLAKADSVNHAIDNRGATEDKNEKEDKQKESNWYVKLLVSPDFSAIGYTRPGKTGFNIGLMVEYSPTRHWGISMGAIWSKKLYDKNNPGKSYSYGGASFEADYLDGDCRVLDIPINITYYILPESRLNFYVTVGASSYIMLKEDYVYTVTENNNNYYYYEDYENENRHWFSMLNLSFGLQYRISPRVQFQVEPFLKAPMSGVGAGKIDLVSAGSFFTLKYKISR